MDMEELEDVSMTKIQRSDKIVKNNEINLIP